MAKLHFFYSTMNAGKSTSLLQSNHNYKESGLETMIFLPMKRANCLKEKLFLELG
jgi:thymidine kinase